MTTQFNIGDRVRTKPGVLATGQAEGVITGGEVYGYEYGVRLDERAAGILGFDADELEALS